LWKMALFFCYYLGKCGLNFFSKKSNLMLKNLFHKLSHAWNWIRNLRSDEISISLKTIKYSRNICRNFQDFSVRIELSINCDLRPKRFVAAAICISSLENGIGQFYQHFMSTSDIYTNRFTLPYGWCKTSYVH